MSIISSTITSAVSKALNSHAQASIAATDQTDATQRDGGFGAASSLSLSPAAQAAISGQSSGPGISTPQPPSQPQTGAGGGGVPAATGASSSDDTEELIEEAYQQVIPKVGVSGASEVIDSKGIINQVKLNELIAQQELNAKNSTVNIAA